MSMYFLCILLTIVMKPLFHILITTTIFYSAALSLSPLLKFSSAAHYATITPTKSIKDGTTITTTLISSGQIFELGFFSPNNSKNRYLGIWYKRTPATIVWVANRNNPLTDSNGELLIRNGNIVLLNSKRSIIWSSNVSRDNNIVVANNSVAHLLDSGNLVLREQSMINANNSELNVLWQSFDYPTDTLLAGMKLGWDLKTGLERYLTSWKSSDDPSTGEFTYRMSITGLPQVILSMGSTRMFRTGTWNGVRFSGLNLLADTIFKLVYVFDESQEYLVFEPTVNSVISIVKMSHLGFSQRLILHSGSSEWAVMYSVPSYLCANYGYCGANAICKINQNPICECFQGFTPSSQEEWKELNWSKGCKRKMPLDCDKGEGFVKIVGVKLPDLLGFWLNKNMSLVECKEACLNNCSCVAYANSDVRGGGSGCLMWFGDLIDINEIHEKDSEQELFIRLSASEIKSIREAEKRKRLKIILVASLTCGACILAVVLCCLSTKLRKKVKVLNPLIGKSKDEDIELPLIDLATISTATNNFSLDNMIGAGGFGPVYKGNLSTGQEIAVKRLSKNSGQGLKEFKNEVELIAKLQHRNLVALLGCCIEGEERILIYEYMPNKSLDHFVFDSERSTILSWKKLFDIVIGIARGLLYLHQDSKLHIVHRDLKASNILLDNNLNPKISDFGLARIFEDDEKEAVTRRVVGTYGYMSPEYAIDGTFSIKSDVFSFGVVLLETVSGKRNRNFKHLECHHYNLLGHAWLLWNEERALDLMNVCLKDSCIESQIVRCIQVGLLCVQKFPNDRPTMSSVIFMLENDGAILPQPKEPGFFTERSSNTTDHECSTSRTEDSYSKNLMSITIASGR